MQPYPCATTTVTPAGRTALCPLPSKLGAIGHLVKTKDLSAFPAGRDEPRSASRPNRGSRAEDSLSAGKANFSYPQGDLSRIPRISRTYFLQRDAPYHAYHAYHAPFPSAAFSPSGMNAAKAPEVSQGWKSLVAGFKSLPVEEISMSTEGFSVPTIPSRPVINAFVACTSISSPTQNGTYKNKLQK